MILIVAEKPSVARDIARVLQCTTRHEGYLSGKEYCITWAVGHLVTLCEPDELDEKYKKWQMEALPILPTVIPTKVIPMVASQFKIIKSLMLDEKIESLICATDAGREGELIFRLIYEKAKCKKSVQRLWISSMTDDAIKEGFETLKPSTHYDGLYQSALCRSHADWLVGMNASRAFTLRYNTLLSIGRVQTPTLAIIVKRHHEIANFVPVEYHMVTAEFGDYQGQWVDLSVKDERISNRIQTGEQAKQIVSDVKHKPARVKTITREEKRELPGQLYDLTSLQRDANRQFAFTADKTLKVAQSLYEKWKMLTYPRTDSRYLPTDMLGKLKSTLLALPPSFQPHVKGIPWQADGKLPVSKRVFDNEKITDHHAIVPTAQTKQVDKLPPDERKLFDLVTKQTIAAFHPPFEYTQVKVLTECETHIFKSTGRIIKSQGYKTVFQQDESAEGTPKKKGKKKEGDTMLPPLKEGDERTVQKVTSKKEATKPPTQHTDASLLSSMENAGKDIEDEAVREQMKGSGMGTPATRASIIERLLKVGYIKRQGKSIQATEKGIQLIDVAPEEITSAETTGRWELALNDIAGNKGDATRFMQGIRNMTGFLVNHAKTTKNAGSFPVEEKRYGTKGKKPQNVQLLPDVTCPLCGAGIQISPKAYGCSEWHKGCKFTIWKDCFTRVGGPLFTDALVTLLLQKKTLSGSTGQLHFENNFISFIPNNAQDNRKSICIIYERKK